MKFLKSFDLITKQRLLAVYKSITCRKSDIAEWFKIINQTILIIKFILFLVKHF
jgi:hypothetical protein